MIKKSSPITEKKTFLPIFSIVAGLAFCLLVGCGGGGGSTTSSRTPEPDINCRPGSGEECQVVDLPNVPDTPDDFLPDAIDPEDPTDTPDMPDPPDTPSPTGLLNQDKHMLVKAPRAWFSGQQFNVYTGKNVVVGVMEEVNSFHSLFYYRDDDGKVIQKIHSDSILTSLYPADVPEPDEKFIVRMDDFAGAGYPDYPCLFELGIDCYDNSGNTKYFLRLNDGTLGLLPGLRDPSLRQEHECPMFDLGDGPVPVCPEFGASHGTGVASVAAAFSVGFQLGGNIDRTLFRGVAYDAEILVYARPLRIAGLPADFNAHARYFQNAPSAAHVYNFSHTFGTRVTGGEDTFVNSGHRQGFASIAEAIRDMGGSQGKPLIAAAGNEGETFPRFPAALPLYFDYLRGQVLAVAATDDNGVITSYSNRCGALPSDWERDRNSADYDGRHYCLAAPGGVSPSTDPFWVAGPGNSEFSLTSGTSFAAPVVAGAFAILKERFRNGDGSDSMNNDQLILRIVDTADNSGRYSEVAVYGAGLLDIEAAIMPDGTMNMSVLGDIDGGITYDFDTTSLSTSAAFGDALQRALQAHEIAAFDELDAPFRYPLASLMETTSSRETLQERHARLFEHDNAPVDTATGGRLALTSTRTGSSEQIDMSLRQPVDIPVAQAELLLTAGDLSTAPLGLHEDKSFAHPYLHFAGEGVGLGGSLQLGAGRFTAMGFTSGSASVSEDIPIDAQGGLLEYTLKPFAGIWIGLQAGAMVEESRALGLLPEGGFGSLGESSTAFAGVSLDGKLKDNWHLRANMLFGRTNLDTPSIGLLKTSTALASSAFRLALEGSDVLLDSDRVDVFVAQPLRIEGGEVDFTVPVGRTPSGLVMRERINGVSLEPGGRELEFGTRYEMQVREDITATGGIGIVHEGGHSKRTATELYGLANLRFRF